jgi:hypothetical protein
MRDERAQLDHQLNIAQTAVPFKTNSTDLTPSRRRERELGFSDCVNSLRTRNATHRDAFR